MDGSAVFGLQWLSSIVSHWSQLSSNLSIPMIIVQCRTYSGNLEVTYFWIYLLNFMKFIDYLSPDCLTGRTPEALQLLTLVQTTPWSVQLLKITYKSSFEIFFNFLFLIQGILLNRTINLYIKKLRCKDWILICFFGNLGSKNHHKLQFFGTQNYLVRRTKSPCLKRWFRGS